jgi:hypothetical protein
MAQDFGWERSAERYLELYREMTGATTLARRPVVVGDLATGPDAATSAAPVRPSPERKARASA